jgi:hypothetical protein
MDPNAPSLPPIRGTAEEMARDLAAFADVGVSHLQLVLDPITERAVADLAATLERLDAMA